MAKHGKPEIFNTDQGSQFTSQAFIKMLKDADIAISMDGKGAWRDNVFVEQLWMKKSIYMPRQCAGGKKWHRELSVLLQIQTSPFIP
jgi:transposase InsO family protein